MPCLSMNKNLSNLDSGALSAPTHPPYTTSVSFISAPLTYPFSLYKSMIISLLLLSFPDIKTILKMYVYRTSRQDGGIGRYALLPHTTKRRTTTNLKTNKQKNQPGLPENPTVWKSDTQGVKEETFTQTCRRVETSSQGRERGCVARWRLVDQVVPHSFADKPGGTTGERNRLHSPGFQHREIKPQNLWL